MAEFEPKDDDTPYANHGARITAYIIDMALLTVSLSLYSFYWLYRTARYGDSLGKKFMGIVIVNKKGETHLGFGKMIMREFIGRFVDSLFLGIGALWLFIDDEHQAIHDKVASTYVVERDAI